MPVPEMNVPTESVHTVQLATVSSVLEPAVLPVTDAPVVRALVAVVPRKNGMPEENVDTWKLPGVPPTAYSAAPTIAAALAGQATVPPPVSVVVLVVCGVKKSCVPAASVPTGAANALFEMAVTVTAVPPAPAPTTQ